MKKKTICTYFIAPDTNTGSKSSRITNVLLLPLPFHTHIKKRERKEKNGWVCDVAWYHYLHEWVLACIIIIPQYGFKRNSRKSNYTYWAKVPSNQGIQLLLLSKGAFTNYVCIFWHFWPGTSLVCTFHLVNYTFFWPPTHS